MKKRFLLTGILLLAVWMSGCASNQWSQGLLYEDYRSMPNAELEAYYLRLNGAIGRLEAGQAQPEAGFPEESLLEGLQARRREVGRELSSRQSENWPGRFRFQER